jgi:hypothetical protein
MKTFRLLLLAACLVLLAFAASAFEARVVVSSFKPDVLATHVPGHLMDNDPATAWVSLGDGSGESVTVKFSAPVRVVRLGIFNGKQGTGAFGLRNRIARGRVVYPDGDEIPFALDDTGGEQLVPCDSGKPVESFDVVVDKVTPKGPKAEHRGVAVSEIKLYLASIPKTKAEISAQREVRQDEKLLDATAPVIRSFLVLNTRLDEDVLLLYPKGLRSQERMNLYVFQEFQKQLGTFEMLRAASVDTSDMTFEVVSNTDTSAIIHAKGNMVVESGNRTASAPVDSDFEMLLSAEEWKIGGERPRESNDLNRSLMNPDR